MRKKSLCIAFLGTDGSGKSTLINKVIPELEKEYDNVFYEHLRPNLLPSIATLLGRQRKHTGPVSNPQDSSASGFGASLLRWGYYLLDYTAGYFLKIFPKKVTKSSIWIFDRYYYDYLIDPKRSRIQLPHWLLKFGQFIIPEPYIILCLGTDAHTIHKRKPELSLEEVKRQVAMLKEFCDKHPRATWIDTGKDIDDSANDALEYIMDAMARRFEQVDIAK